VTLFTTMRTVVKNRGHSEDVGSINVSLLMMGRALKLLSERTAYAIGNAETAD